MKIKQILCTVALASLCCYGCQKDPSTSSLRNEYLVYTAHDAEARFAQIDTYYIPDRILLIGSHTVDAEGNKVPKYWNDADAQELIGTVVAEMDARGYTRLTDEEARETADAGLQLSYVEQATYFVGYNDPYWWSYYPYYWTPGYWGPWTGWYYPYAVYYGYTTGSLLVEMVDLNGGAENGRKLPVIWNCYISGLLRGSGTLDIDEAADGLRQAFAQSPYLKK